MYKAAICVLLTFGAATGALYKKYPLIERQAVDRLFLPTGDTYRAFILFALVKSRHIEVRKQPGCFNYVRSATIEIKTEDLNTGSKPVLFQYCWNCFGEADTLHPVSLFCSCWRRS